MFQGIMLVESQVSTPGCTGETLINVVYSVYHPVIITKPKVNEITLIAGVGISCYRLGELSEAEQALSEANILNNTDPEVWGYLSLVCLKTSRYL